MPRLFSLLFPFFFAVPGWTSVGSQQAFMQSFASSRIEFVKADSPYANNPERYPWLLKILFNHVFTWSPTGEKKNLSAACDTTTWAERLKDPRLSSSSRLQGALLQKYFEQCESETQTGTNAVWRNVMQMLSSDLRPQEHPFLHRVMLHLPGNVKLSAVLALKGDKKKRPLVVMRLGIFSHLRDFRAERPWLMMLFEQSPFNVLVVENLTSPDFISNNSRFSLGGYDEGIQNIHIARLVTDKNEPISQIVDSVHLFGISLGGHGTLFASLLNEYNSPKDRPLIQSFMGICPVVNLKSSFDKLTHSGLRSKVIDLWIQGRLSDLPEKVPGLQKHEAFQFTAKAITELARTYQGGLSYNSSLRLPPGMEDGADFWKLSDFWPYYDNVRRPVVIFANQNDPVVPFRENSEQIQKKLMKIDGRNITVIDLPHGVHCTLPVAYDWSVFSTFINTYFLSHANHFRIEERKFELDMDEEWAPFAGAPVHLNVQKPEDESTYAAFTLTAKKDSEAKSFNLSLPLSGFDFRFHNKELTDAEKNMLVRWLYQNLKADLASVHGKPRLLIRWPVAL